MPNVKRNIISNFITKFWTVVMSFIFIPWYIKFLGIESYGLIGFYATLSTLFSLFDYVLSTTITREMAGLSAIPHKKQEMLDTTKTFEWLYWSLGFFTVMIVLFLSSYISVYWIKTKNLPIQSVQQAVCMMGFIIAIQLLNNFYQGALNGLQRQVSLNIVSIIVATLKGFGTILILWLISPTIQMFFLWQLFINAIGMLVNLKLLWGYLPKSKLEPVFKWQLVIPKWRFASGMAGIYLTGILLMQLDKVIIIKTLSLEMFGYYSLATVIANILSYISSPIQTAIFPRFTQLINSGEKTTLKELYHKTSQWTAVLLFPMALVIILFSSEIVKLWTGNAMIADKTSTLVSILAIGTALGGVMNLPSALQFAFGWTKLALCSNVVAVILLSPLIYFMVLKYSLMGAALCWVILNLGYFLISVQCMHRRLLKGEEYQWYFIDIGIPLMVSVIISGLWRFLCPEKPSFYFFLFYLSLTFATTFLGAVLATPFTRHKIITIVSAQLKDYLSRNKKIGVLQN